MARVKRGNVARKRRNKILKLAKGFRGSHSKLFRTANQQVMKALRYAYRHRRNRKRDFRRLWTTRINAAARLHGVSYSQLTGQLKKANIDLNS
jgi:large subunit ribosomal protein L20